MKKTKRVMHRAKSSRYNKSAWVQRHPVGRKALAKSLLANNPKLSSKEAARAVDDVFKGMECQLKQYKRLSQPGFGTFVIKSKKGRPARMGRNPFTGEMQRFKARPSVKVIKFRASKRLKGMLN